ncbi:nitrous oxide reductase accessory protein NosL [Domibacillus mangrovi]|uniref:nitrous oxide reductase accessory protein NosL n=1 Tax=Domibacillus mangrovi TaxID=1714354 RepID=UPI0009F9E750|nr:nitrous oxide reductase accessory protein NosL [Domibacillus mangrovi]
MKNKILALVTLAIVLVGCSEQSYEPKEINPETAICKICNMSITEMDFAGQIIFKNGDHDVYDDLGCLVEYILESGEDKIGAAYIKDAQDHTWIDVKEATYVYASDIWTPMNYGVLAFASKEQANQYLADQGTGKLLAYEDLLTFEWGIHTH